MTVMEAALAAFQQEQRLLHRARKQLHKVPPARQAAATQASRAEVAAAVEEEGQQEGWESERLQGARQGLQPAGPAVGPPPAPLSSDSDSIPHHPVAAAGGASGQADSLF
ncbi:hypothetical protein HaLaN_14614 [Haematococcus lacustris]|uniref:Uncharacterized protein n=1 Tax=Haematococcus lacustris TaxID=44745 RepID=A0A699ZPS2_HAELA|nr:hypothetical protein HaLaN_14614 [Haematococcus lacustris]